MLGGISEGCCAGSDGGVGPESGERAAGVWLPPVGRLAVSNPGRASSNAVSRQVDLADRFHESPPTRAGARAGVLAARHVRGKLDSGKGFLDQVGAVYE